MKISVITPTRKIDKALEDAIKSVREQDTTCEVEHWIIVDCPGEPLPEIIKNRHHCLHFVRNTRQPGPSGARNTGLDLATGEFIFFLDADDLWPSEYVRSVLAVFDVQCQVTCVSTPGFTFGCGVMHSTMTTPFIDDGLIASKQVAWNVIGCPSGFSFRRTKAIDQVRFCEEARYCEDYLLYLELLGAGAKFWRFNGTKYGYRRSSTQSTSAPLKNVVQTSQETVVRQLEKLLDVELLSRYVVCIAKIQIARLCKRLMRKSAFGLSLALCFVAPSWVQAQLRRAIRRNIYYEQ